MLITFKTESYANITMLGDIGKKMLEYMNFGNSIPGAIVHEDLAQALANLQRALNAIPQAIETDDSNPDDEPAIGLNTRALPLIELLESAIAADNNVRWE